GENGKRKQTGQPTAISHWPSLLDRSGNLGSKAGVSALYSSGEKSWGAKKVLYTVLTRHTRSVIASLPDRLSSGLEVS
ncbi:hypothetical protein HPB47_005383, partial [Ixodes persulcatus]